MTAGSESMADIGHWVSPIFYRVRLADWKIALIGLILATISFGIFTLLTLVFGYKLYISPHTLPAIS
jgi:hypothetical protein